MSPVETTAGAAATPHVTCVTCDTPVRGAYCHACGERAATNDDLRVRVFLADVAEAAFNLDSRLWRSLRALLVRPGELTAEYMRGRRKPYLGPVQLFVIANVVFFSVLSTIGGFEVFTTTLRNHVGMVGYGAVAGKMVEARASLQSPERAAYQRRFDDATPRYANSLVIIMVPMLAALLFLLYGGRKYFVHQLVFSLHFFAWLLLLFTALPIVLRLLFEGMRWFSDDSTVHVISQTLNDDEIIIGLAVLALVTWYLSRALHRAYDGRLILSVSRALLACVLLLPIVLVYRAFLFFAVYFTLD